MSFGSGGGGGGSGNTNRFEPPDWTRMSFPDAVQAASTLYTQPQQHYYGQQIAGINDTQAQGMQYLSNISGNTDPAMAAMLRNAQLTASGAFENPYALLQTQVGANPFADPRSSSFVGGNQYIGRTTDPAWNEYIGMSDQYRNMKQSAMDDVVRNYQNAIAPQTDAAFNHAGAFHAGGHDAAISANQNNLARNLGRLSSEMDVGQWNRSGDIQQQLLQMNQQAQAGDLARNSNAQQNWLNYVAGIQQGDAARMGNLYQQGINLGVQAQQGDIERATQGWDAERNRAMGLFNPLMGYHQQQIGDARNMIGIGDIQRGYTQDLLNGMYNDWQQQQNYAPQMLDNLLSVLSRASGNYGQNSTMTQGGGYQANPFATAVGLGALGAGAYNAWGG